MKKRVISVILALILVFGTMPITAMAAGEEMILTATPQSGATLDNLRIGNTVTVTVKIPTEATFATGQVELSYPNTLFDVTSATSTFDSAPSTAVSGKVIITPFQMNDATYPANTTLLTVVFTAKAKGTGSFSLANCILESVETGLGVGFTSTSSVPVTVYQELTGATALTGSLTAPSKNGTDASAFTGTNVTAAVGWSPALAGGKFAGDTAYTATVTVSPNAGYKFGTGAGVTADGLTFTKSGDNFVATKTFPKTAGKETPTVTTLPTASAITYSQTLADSELSGGEFSVPGTFAWTTPATAPQVSDSNDTEYSVTFSPADTTNYTTATCKVKLKVNPKPLTDVAIGAIADQTWTGNQITPTPTVTSSETLNSYTLKKDTDYTVSYGANAAVAANGGSVTVHAKEGSNYTFADATKNFNIVPKTGTVSISGNMNKTYDGNPVTTTGLTVEKNGSAGAVSYTYYTNAACTEGETTTAPTNAGRYWVKASMEADTNYGAAQSNALAFIVSPKALQSSDFVFGTNPTYTGSEQAMPITSDLSPSDYSLNANCWLTDVSASDVTATITGAGNYTGTVSHKWNLTPVGVTITGITASNKPYDGTAAATAAGTATVSGKLGEDDVSVSAGTAAFADQYVGTGKTVTFTGYSLTGAKAKNYNLTAQPAGVMANITAIADPAVIITTATVKKGGNTVNLSTLVSGAKGTVSYEVTDGLGTVTANGVYTSPATTGTATVKVTIANKDMGGSEDAEYIGKTQDITITIQDKNTASLSASQRGCTYGQTLPNPVYTAPAGVIEGGTTITYAGTLRDGVTDYPASVNKPTEAGTYTVTVRCETADTVYTSAAKTFTIAPKSITGAVVTLGAALTYTGSEQTQSVTKVELGAADITAACEVSNNKGTDVAAYTLTVTAKDSGNYTGRVTKGFSIAKKTIAITGATAVGRDYAANNKAVEITAVTFDGAVLTKGTDYTVTGTMANANAGTDKPVTVKVLLKGNAPKNYSLAVSTYETTVEIAKATPATPQPVTGDYRYTDTGAKTKSVAELLPADAGSVTYALGSVTDSNDILGAESVGTDGKVSFTVNGGKAAGNTATIPVTISSTNYADVTVDVVVTLKERDVPTLDAKDIAKTYDGTAVSAAAIKGTAKFGSITVPGTWSFTTADTYVNVNDSNSAVSVTFTPTDDVNYAATTDTIAVTIKKAKPTGAPAFTAIKTDGKYLSDADLTVGSIAPAGTIDWVLDDAATEVKKNQSYGWLFVPTDTANYESLSGVATPWRVAGSSYSGYTVTKGANVNFKAGSAAEFSINRAASELLSVKVDSAPLTKGTDYTVSSGSTTTITLTASAVKKLSNGFHSLYVTYQNGYASTYFTLSEGGVVSAKTGDAGVALYAMMALSSAAGAVWVTRKKKEDR